MANTGFEGYYMKIGNCEFNDPAFKREGFKFAPKLVQVGDSSVVASGKLKIKVLPHDRGKIWCSFPPMTPSQFRVYWDALHSDSGGKGMYLTVEVFDDSTNTYYTGTFYHSDLQYTPIIYGGQRMIQIDDFELIEH